MRRALLVLPLILLAAVLLRPAAGSAEDLPAGPVVRTDGLTNFHQDVRLRGGATPFATITVKDASGATVPCRLKATPFDQEFLEGPVVAGPEGDWTCYLDGDVYFTSDKTRETSLQLSVFQLAQGVESAGTPAVVTFAKSLFSIDTPPNLPAGDVIELRGLREDGVIGEIRIEWSVEHDGEPLFPTRLCDVGQMTENQEFVCTYDSTDTDPRDDRFAPLSLTPALFVTPAVLVTPIALQEGEYTATFNELLNDVPIDSMSFDFTVGDVNNAPPGAPPGEGPTDDVAGPAFETIPLAPIPTPAAELDDSPVPTDEPDEATEAARPVDDDVLRILILAVIAFTVMAMSGARGLGAPRRLVEAPIGGGPSPQHLADPLTRDAGLAVIAGLGGQGLDGAGDDAGRARPFGDAWGDRSITWRFPGWTSADRLSLAVPVALAPRLPLVARITADGSYLRAALGALWALLPAAGVILGTVAAATGGAAPLPPALGLVAALLVLAVVDAAAGIAAVTAFTAVTLARGGLTAQSLDLDEGLRGLMGLAALWFVAPLVAAAARPLRRAAEPEHVYPWDRFGDTVIAALISGWAVQGIVGALGDLTGRELSLTSHADGLALLTIAAVIGRFVLEEAAASLYPRRLQAVQKDTELPAPTTFHQVRGLVFRAALLTFFAGAFLGNCWQLWVGVAIFAIPQVLQLMGDRLPDIPPIAPTVPRGVVQTLVLVSIGAAIAYLVDSRGSDDELTAIRQGFVLLAVPGAALEILSVLGGDTPKPRWTWPRQLAGAGVVALTASLVLFFL